MNGLSLYLLNNLDETYQTSEVMETLIAEISEIFSELLDSYISLGFWWFLIILAALVSLLFVLSLLAAWKCQ